MLGLDTNILVRYVVRDDARHLAQVDRLFERRLSKITPGFVNSVVLAEFVWVLERTYRFARPEIAAAVADLIGSEQIELEHDACIEEALEIFTSTPVGFTDILISLINRTRGCATTLTMDRGQRHLKTATVLL
ncbi:MAG: type II toxin-antitoxin system VapC family toxin [Rhodospirillaceae bacterium]|nr:type II toxin-antitoxin system VapC family toxin [Rhodospirillaceae bacterium]